MLHGDEPLTREQFRKRVYAAEPESIRDTEIDFLFDLLDHTKNDLIDKHDFPMYSPQRINLTKTMSASMPVEEENRKRH